MTEEVPYKLDQKSLVKAGYRHQKEVEHVVRRVNRWIRNNPGAQHKPPYHIMEKMSHFRRNE